jgi:protein phosphatase
VREHNEDTFGTDADIGLVVLADGMGGYKAGEVASGITVRTVMGLLKEAIESQDLTIQDQQLGMSRPGILLRDAIQRANKIIYQTARTQTHCEGMGTTVVAGLFFDDKLTIAHVGDSRLYRMRAGKFEQITQDHSLLQELILARVLHARRSSACCIEELRHARARRRIERRSRDHRIARREDDLFLLCSDGLSDMVEDDDIQLTISTFGANLETLAKQLVLLSNENGGRDNVSIVLVRALEPFPAQRGMIGRLLGLFG